MAVHRSMIVVDGLDPSALSEEYLDMLQAAGVSCWAGAIGDLEGFALKQAFCEAHSDRILFAKSVKDIRAAHGQGKIAFIAPWQDAGLLISEGSCYAPAFDNLRAYRELGLRICGIAYNLSNSFGGGCLEPQIGLTRLGYRLVEEIHRLRIVLDIGGHTGEQASLDALAASRGVPLVCTHTNIRTLNDNPRCTSDAVLEGIARSGGVIGVCAFNDFHARSRYDKEVRVTPQVSLEQHLDQYDYLRRRVGVDHIGLGPDFIHGRGLQGPLSREQQEIMPPEAYSIDLPWHYVAGFAQITALPNVTRGLMQRGWPIGDIRKVLGENWLRVYEQVWGA